MRVRGYALVSDCTEATAIVQAISLDPNELIRLASDPANGQGESEQAD